jgi:hypothetical protein
MTDTAVAATPRRGGAAAIYGFLYQLLVSSARLVEAMVDQPGASEPDTVTAVLEPAYGSDLEILAIGRTCIQFKHRSTALDSGELIDSVFADLFLAHCAAPADRYELQCSHALTEPAQRLVEGLGGVTNLEPDAEPLIRRLRSRCEEIFKARCARPNQGFDAEFATFTSRFVLGPRIDSNQARQFLETWLQGRLPYIDRVEATLDQLIGNLLARSAANDAKLSAGEFLELIDLRWAPARHDLPRQRLHERLLAALEARRFVLDHDVRDVLLPEAAEPITLVAGPSGSGKTWALCRIAHERDARGDAVLLVSAPTLNMLQEQLRRAVAIEALDHESPIETSALGRLWRRSIDRPEAELWVLWEGCRDPEELIHLQLHNGLGAGIRLVAELPPGALITDTPLANVPTQILGEFSESELFDALARRGVMAGRVPKPIRRMLRLPVLCGIYASLATEIADWNPTNEYIVLERFWERAQQRVGSLAGVQLRRMAHRLLERHRTRLTDEDLADIGLTDATLTAFVNAGWLARLDQRWAFAHERLLTWAVAEALSHQFLEETIDSATLASTIRSLGVAHEDKARLQKLGFLLMDVLWLVMRRNGSEVQTAALLAALEADPDTGQNTLYRELLPTAGAIIIPFLLARLRLAQPPQPGHAGDVAACLVALPPSEVDQSAVAAALAAIDTPSARTVLLLVGHQWPLLAQHDAIWTEFIDLYRARRGEDFDLERYQYLDAALLCASTQSPDWLRDKIAELHDTEELGQALTVLTKLPHRDALPIWNATAEKLVTALIGSLRATLIGCIGRFEDHSRRDLLRQAIEVGVSDARPALAALAAIDPDDALAAIATHPPLGRLPPGRLWFDQLLDAQPVQAAALIREWLLARDPSGRLLAQLWLNALERVDDASLCVMLGILARHGGEGWRDDRAANALFDVLGHLQLGPEHSDVFIRWQTSPLAGQVLERATSRLAGDHEHATSVRRLLRRIGGPAYETFLLRMLNRPLGQCLTGIRSSLFAPTPNVISRLEALVEDWTTECEDEVRIELWRTLWGIDAERWYPNVLSLLEENDPARIHLGIFLLREGGRDDMLPAVLACVARSEPGSRTEALAMGLAIHVSEGSPILFERARARFQQASDDDDGRVATFNVMLKDRSPEGRALLDAHLLEIAGARSFKSYDLDLLAIRLGQSDVGEALVQAGARFMRRPSFFGESIIDAYVARSPIAAKNALLDRAFAVPDIMTNGQPDAIRTLAELDPALAAQAFVQSWRDHQGRRLYLAPVARALGEQAIQAMVDHLAEDLSPSGNRQAFRRTCVELRRRHAIATSMLLTALATASQGDRLALCEALGWMPGADDALLEIETTDPDPDLRQHAYGIRKTWHRYAWAVDNFRAHPASFEAMEYVIDTVDPAIVCNFEDPWGIIPLIQHNSRLMMYAEAQFARRYNEMSGSKLKRVRLRPRVLTADVQ